MEEARSSSIISIQRCRVWSCHSARPIRYSRCSFVEAPAQFVRIKSGQARQPANVLSVACGVPLQFQERKIVRIGNPEMYSLEHTRTILVEPALVFAGRCHHSDLVHIDAEAPVQRAALASWH